MIGFRQTVEKLTQLLSSRVRLIVYLRPLLLSFSSLPLFLFLIWARGIR